MEMQKYKQSFKNTQTPNLIKHKHAFFTSWKTPPNFSLFETPKKLKIKRNMGNDIFSPKL